MSEPECRRALPLLASASADTPLEAVTTLSIGERDFRLLRLREWTFGSRLSSVADCSACGERLEWTVDTGELQMEGSAPPAGVLSLAAGAYAVEFRVPNVLDLEALGDCADLAAGHGVLLDRCVLTAKVDGQETPAAALPPHIVASVVKCMAEADPHADVKFDLHCPACGNDWQALFDIESFFWNELNAWARRMLVEVHLLARAYGWRETDILSLSAWRRQFYVDLASGLANV